jgi:hypothetical protein
MAKNRKSGSKHGSNHGSATSSAVSSSTGPSNHQNSVVDNQSLNVGNNTISGGGTILPNSSSPKGQINQQTSTQQQQLSLYEWLFRKDSGGIYYLVFFMICGFIFGFLFGNVQDTAAGNNHFLWRTPSIHDAYTSISTSSSLLDLVESFGNFVSNPINSITDMVSNVEFRYETDKLYNDPRNTRIFSVLREAVVREAGGYVHRDLGIMIPAPCGSVRGLGMVWNKYYMCQHKCFPNNEDEKLQLQEHRAKNNITVDDLSNVNHDNENNRIYRQDNILIRIPLSYQMTRNVAYDVFDTLIPQDVQIRTKMHALDDSMILTLFLAHERGIGKYSKWLPYIASLPREPTCGYSRRLRPYMLNAIEAYRVELDVDTNGWGEELYKALIYADRIVENINNNFGSFLESPPGISSIENIRWALCQVVSHGIAGSSEHGSLRLVPVVDLINHDADAGGIVELDGKERIVNGDFLDAISEFDNGTIVVRSMRHGRLRPLRLGQELLVNYNVPYYTPLDWLVYSGFVPPERTGPWIKMDAVIPPVRRDGPFAFEYGDPGEHLQRKEEQLLHHIRNAEAASARG